MKHKCQSCKNSEGEIKCVLVIGGERIEKYLCRECARKAGIEEQLKMNRKKAKEFVITGQKKDTVCSSCTMSFSRFIETGLLGCPECYEAFGNALRDILKGIHSVSYHRGRGPGDEKTLDIAHLKWKLSEAIRSEDFELAARLRDEIKMFERGNN